MKTSPNIGIVNALIRITCGLTIVAYFTAKLSRKPWCNSYLIMILMGAMKVAEGIVRYCPVTELYQKGQGMMNQNNSQQKQHNESQNNNQDNIKNPPSIPPELADSIKDALD
ncbi:YgaP family membrane protein [Heyndrickxia camelliae]|uniref:DUF2892 domain-containing protein n=1 Tax=Heyndrickxia camelliae TaxID=1707093 RepID=A0A2N3LH71_9BACI|nr:DUF2892 domain-containing protein [Heyndrickxia camelliae]PKR83980.1 DUF2892 domain-containing protein [Heyndrickxia camelliae]